MNNLKKNILYNFLYQILIIFLPLVTAPYLSRVIGPNGVGTYSFSYSMALYFTYITLLGLTNYGNRSIASVQNDYVLRSKIFSEIYFMQMITFIISACVYAIYVFFFAIDKGAAIIMGIFVLSSLFDINWFFFGMELFKLTVTRNTVIKIGTAIFIFVFVKEKSDVYKYILIMSVGTLLSQILLWPFLKKYISFEVPKLKDITKHFKPNLTLFVPVIAISLYNIMNKIMLGYLSSMSEVGYYENAEKIIRITLTLITAVGTVMLPRMTALVSSNKAEESKKYLDTSMMIVLAYVNAVMFGIFAVAKDFVSVFYGEGFLKSGQVMIYLAVTIVLIGVGNVIRTQFLIPNRKDKIYITSAIIGSTVNIIINVFLIPKFASIGAAIGTIAAELSVFIYQVNAVKKEINLKSYLKYEVIYFSFGMIMFFVINIIPKFSNEVVNLLSKIIVGAVIYLVLTLVYLVRFEKYRISIKCKL